MLLKNHNHIHGVTTLFFQIISWNWLRFFFVTGYSLLVELCLWIRILSYRRWFWNSLFNAAIRRHNFQIAWLIKRVCFQTNVRGNFEISRVVKEIGISYLMLALNYVIKVHKEKGRERNGSPFEHHLTFAISFILKLCESKKRSLENELVLMLSLQKRNWIRNAPTIYFLQASIRTSVLRSWR